jgi:hypothetical protein
MGTSSSNYGPKSNTPLLPDWSDTTANNGNQDGSNKPNSANVGQSDQNQDNQKTNTLITGNWSGARRALGAFSKKPNKLTFGRAAKSYVKASGGAINIVKSANHGKIVANQFASFLNNIRTDGIDKAYENLGNRKISGDSVEQVFNNLAELLSSSGGTDEETIARNAVIEALAKLYEDFDIENNPIESLDNLTEEQTGTYLEYYLTSYIYERWLNELGFKIEESNISPAEAVRAERNAYDFIQATVSLKFDGYNLTSFDYHSEEGKAIIEEIFIQAYTLIETL